MEIIRVIYQITLVFDADYEYDVILTLTLNPTRYPILSEGKNYKKRNNSLIFDADYQFETILTLILNLT